MTLQVQYVPLPPEHSPAWREGMRLLVELLTSQVENASILVVPVDELVVEI
jgi:hypothetical protein